MDQEYRIKNLRKAEYILGAIQLFRTVTKLTEKGDPVLDEKKNPVKIQVEDYVRPAEVIAPGEASQPMSLEQLKVFDTASMQHARLVGDLDILINGKSMRKPDPAPAKARSLSRTEPDDTAEARQLAELLGGGPKPVTE